jgi:DNA-binding transcriptional ArsR family regulator
MFKAEILKNERRRKIYTVIEATPGVHLRELQRILKIPLASLDYHLSYMTRKKIVLSETDGHHKRYYTKPLDAEDNKVFSALRQKRMREIVLSILASKKVNYQLLSCNLKIPPSTLSYYLKYLVDNNVLARDKIGYENIYTIKDEDRVAKVLIAYKSSFSDKLVDKALNTWMEKTFIRRRTMRYEDLNKEEDRPLTVEFLKQISRKLDQINKMDRIETQQNKKNAY